ncbi:hypothetical protein [Nitrolancea hollandica]|uniref:Uncharacterized protein n=1 Tax=Nitrolancea hollandica Lb TaxID=1129897 RepID=I4EK39_9BACT|nr:hypothetical protein [Nitrolancea hollandica]CCF85051.1 hypothetical protein NITHO_440001 [Nitrolancea hollandica Lb]
MTATIETTATEALEAVKRLEAEQAAIPTEMQAAARAGDSGQLIELQRRQERIPHELFAARIALLNAKERDYDRRADEAKKEMVDLKPRIAELEEQHKKIQSELLRARNHAGVAERDARDLRNQAARCRREREDLIAAWHERAASPVVRVARSARG